MEPRQLGSTSLKLSPIGFGAFKIGRNEKTKYAQPYELPDDQQVASLLQGVIDLGINYIDTAPAYGCSEQRLGEVIGPRSDIVISTKVGETFEHGQSHYDFSAAAIRTSVQQSMLRLQRDVLDLVFIHSDGRDREILADTDAVETLRNLREEGFIRAIGFSGKTVQGAQMALAWADALMVQYNLEDTSHQQVIDEAAAGGVGVVVKKGLASGKLPAKQAIEFILANQAVTSLVVGGLNPAHLRENVSAASACDRGAEANSH